MRGWKHNWEWTCDSTRCVGSEEGTSQVGAVRCSNKLGWDIYKSCCTESVFERGHVEVDCWVRRLWWSGVLTSWGLSHWLLSLLHQSLSVVDKVTFWNCLVAMRPRATKADIPSTHDITTFIHNAFTNFLKELKAEIKVCFFIFPSGTVSDHFVSPQQLDGYQPRWTLGPLNRQNQASLESLPTGFTSVKWLGLPSGPFSQEWLLFVASQALTLERISCTTSSSYVSGWG